MVEERNESSELHLNADVAAACIAQCYRIRSTASDVLSGQLRKWAMLPIVPSGIPPSVYAETSSHSQPPLPVQHQDHSYLRSSRVALPPNPTIRLTFTSRKPSGPREYIRPTLAFTQQAFPIGHFQQQGKGAVPASSSEPRLWKSQLPNLPLLSRGRMGLLPQARDILLVLLAYYLRGEGIYDHGSPL
ncbi:hypothetical protein FIBSPDRAFT_591860 [Athelia psychrophila]|uniref:Uncharacterized protein n=1 Tax=Athelia psychrophila TaxID=1759441 RepID=A0A166H424_9AGAM|nr:hypothetical protein FIBSPDRAFT_591860 [Fibularhizoctonia sp. CBS 109695]